MERRNDDEPNSAFQKKLKHTNLQIGNQKIQQLYSIIPDAFGLEDYNKKNEMKNTKLHDLRDEFSNQKWKISLSCLKGKN